jgi:hypothetical protein
MRELNIIRLVIGWGFLERFKLRVGWLSSTIYIWRILSLNTCAVKTGN